MLRPLWVQIQKLLDWGSSTVCHRFPHTCLTFPTSLGIGKILRDRKSQHRLVSDQLGCYVPSTSGCCCIPQMLLPEASVKYRNSLNTDKESILKSARLEDRSHPTRRQREAKRGWREDGGEEKRLQHSVEAFSRIKNRVQIPDSLLVPRMEVS